MGIQDLYKLIDKYAPDAKTVIPVSDLDGLTIVFDASISVYQLHSSAWDTTGAAIGMFYRVSGYLRKGIRPVFVFDGAPPDEKAAVIEQRGADRDAGRVCRVPQEVFNDVREIIELLGVQCVQAPGEGETQAVALCTHGANANHANGTAGGIIPWGVATEDSDALTFGAPRIIRGLTGTAKTVVVIDRAKLLECLGLTSAQFTDLCILLGCDYSPRHPGMGPASALKTIRKHGSIDAAIAAGVLKSDSAGREGAPVFTPGVARTVFTNPLVDRDVVAIPPRPLLAADIAAIKQWMNARDAQRACRAVDTLAKHYGVI